MRLAWCFGGLLALAVLGGGCKKAGEGSTATKSLAVASEVLPPPPVKVAPEPTLEYEVLRAFPPTTQIDVVSNGIVFCECTIDSKPDKGDRAIYFFDGTSFAELKGLVSDRKISALLGENLNRMMTPPKDMRVSDTSTYHFWGVGPDHFVLVAHSFWDDDDTTRDGSGGEEREFTQTKSGWQSAPGATASVRRTPSLVERPRTAPRAYDAAFLHAPTWGVPVVGNGGPTLLIRVGGLEVWDGKAWQAKDAPWAGSFGESSRLTDGRTLVGTGSAAYVVDKSGNPKQIHFDNSQHDGLKLVAIHDKPFYLLGRTLLGPKEDVRLAPWQPREPPAPWPKPPGAEDAGVARVAPSAVPSVAATVSASADAGEAPAAPVASALPQPSGSPAAVASGAPSAGVASSAAPSASAVALSPEPVAPPASAEPSAPPGMPPMTAFSPSCKTPFVLLVTPPSSGWNYGETARNLHDAAPFQDRLTFVEFERKVTYFGAQADDESVARQLIDVYKRRVPRAKPILGCLDARSYLPDPYQPKWDAQIVLLNLRVGTQFN